MKDYKDKSWLKEEPGFDREVEMVGYFLAVIFFLGLGALFAYLILF